jgi:hypothetical protein
MPRISEIAHRIDELSEPYRIGDLQALRKRIKGMGRQAGSTIFHPDTISDEQGWAFHYGGRKELQFNIGEEEEGLRYGVAFSLEQSQTLPDIELLFPKIMRFNQFIRENPGFFRDYRMWHWYLDRDRSAIQSVTEIGQDLLRPKTFIFIGKLNEADEIDYSEILRTFDELLTPYIYVEKGENSGIIEAEIIAPNGFSFSSGQRNLVFNRTYSTKEKYTDLDIRHSLILEKLATELIANYGEENVAVEHPCFGKSIDAVLRLGAEYVFYEVKTCGSAKGCIREALGQVMEYAYWPGEAHAKKIVVVGEPEIDPDTMNYLDFLNRTFALPVEYQAVSIGP